MIIHPHAEFQADIPADVLEEDGVMVQTGSKALAEEIALMLRQSGFNAEDPLNQEIRGFDFEVKMGRARIWVLISDLGDCFLLQSKSHAGLFGGRRAQVSHAEVLNRINAFFAADRRFTDVRWKFDWGILDGLPGEGAPVAS